MMQGKGIVRTAGLTGAIGVIAAGALVSFGAGPATATTPKDTGCSNGQLVLSISSLVEQGYNPDIARFDLNGDGLICGLPLSPRQQTKKCEAIGGCTVPVIYYLSDNRLTPAH
jgi:hypothetical protein